MPTEELVPAHDLPENLVQASDLPDDLGGGSLRDRAKQHLAGGMGAEQIGKTSGPGVLGALKDSYLGQAGENLSQSASRAVSGAKRFASSPGQDIMETISHPTQDSGLTDALSGILGVVSSGFAPLGAGAAELTRGATELAGASPETAKQYGSRAAQASEMIGGGLPLVHSANMTPAETYGQDVTSDLYDKQKAAEPGPLDGARQGAARYLAKSALKPGKSHGTPEKISAAIDLQLKEGFKPSNIDAAEAYREKVGSGLRETYAQSDEPTIDTNKIVEAIEKAKSRALPSEQRAIDSAVGEDVLGPLRQEDGSYRNMTPSEAFDLKIKLQKAVSGANKQFYRTGVGTPGTEGRASSAGAIGQQLVEQFPQVKGENAKYSAISTLIPILEDAQTRISKHEPFGISSWVAGSAGAVAHGAKGGLTGLILGKLVSDPRLRLRAAIALSKSSGGELSIAQAKQGIEEYVTVYHGTPHEFDKFDMSKVGTGEGAQAYGHGLYFAENKGVADQYAKEVIDKPYLDSVNTRLSALAREMDSHNAGQYGKFRDARGYELKAEYDKLMMEREERARRGGKTLEVNVPKSAVSKMLDWDKPLSEQPAVVQDLARRADLSHMEPGNRTRRQIEMWRDGTLPNTESAPTGHALYNALTKYGTDTESNIALTAKLRDAGIPGIRYLDQGSRAIIERPRQIEMNDGSIGWEVDSPTGTRKFTDKPAADAFYRTVASDKTPTHNYVLFDDQLPKIRKPGEPPPGTPQPPPDRSRPPTKTGKVLAFAEGSQAERKRPEGTSGWDEFAKGALPSTEGRDERGRFISRKTRLSELAKH